MAMVDASQASVNVYCLEKGNAKGRLGVKDTGDERVERNGMKEKN